MKKRVAVVFLIPLLLHNILGCAPLLVGMAVGGVGVFAISKDTVQGETDKAYDSIWNAALTVSRIRGAIKQEDYTRGYIELGAGSSHIWIRLIRLTHATNRLKISARNKIHLPDLSTAQDIFVKIMEEAK